MENLVNAVRQHADREFSNGWDFIAETFTDGDIAAEIKGCRTIKGAIRKMKAIADIYAEQQSNCY